MKKLKLKQWDERYTVAPPVCHYCEEVSEKGETEYYGKIIYHWHCKECKAAVGCHGRTDIPLGFLANKRLKRLRIRTHDIFDIVWRDYKVFDRNTAYKWLAGRLSIPEKYCHIGMFDEELCKETMKIVATQERLINEFYEKYRTAEEIIEHHYRTYCFDIRFDKSYRRKKSKANCG